MFQDLSPSFSRSEEREPAKRIEKTQPVRRRNTRGAGCSGNPQRKRVTEGSVMATC